MNSILEEFVPSITILRKEYAFQSSALEFLEEKGYNLLGRLGSGSTSFAFLALDEKQGKEVAIVIPVFGSEPESLEWIVEAQKRGKLRDVCTLYETFPIEGLLCEELYEEARNDKSWEDGSEPIPPILDIHHIQVVELLTLIREDDKSLIREQFLVITERMFEEGYVYDDVHSYNLAYNLEGELKFIDLMSVRIVPDEEEFMKKIFKCAPRLLDIVDSSGLGFVYNYFYYRILEDVESIFVL